MGELTTRESYEEPVVRDYGDLTEITGTVAFSGREADGGEPLVPHSAPSEP